MVFIFFAARVHFFLFTSPFTALLVLCLFYKQFKEGSASSVNKLGINWLFVALGLLLLNVGYNDTLIRSFYTALVCSFVQGPVRRTMEDGFHGIASIFQGSRKLSTEYYKPAEKSIQKFVSFMYLQWSQRTVMLIIYDYAHYLIAFFMAKKCFITRRLSKVLSSLLDSTTPKIFKWELLSFFFKGSIILMVVVTVKVGVKLSIRTLKSLSCLHVSVSKTRLQSHWQFGLLERVDRDCEMYCSIREQN